MSPEEIEIRERVARELSTDLMTALENVAHLGLDAVRPRPNCDTTYIQMINYMIINRVKYGLK
jgi:hypothetical protein